MELLYLEVLDKPDPALTVENGIDVFCVIKRILKILKMYFTICVLMVMLDCPLVDKTYNYMLTVALGI